MAGNSSSSDIDGIGYRAASLILMQGFIIPGNSMILIAISTFNTRTVSDILIGCLALVDLLNGLGPVDISIAMYYSHPKGFNGIDGIKWLCLLYTWMSCVLRLMACLTATLMSMDRYVAIVVPFQYRTKVTPNRTCLLVLALFFSCVVIGLLPVVGATGIHVFAPMCSFDFTGAFAAFIVVLGYIQILIVIVCYVSVMLEINSFLSRQTLLKATQLRASFAFSKSRQSSKKNDNGVETTQSCRFKSSQSVVRSMNSPRIQLADKLSPKSRSNSLMPLSTERQLGFHADRSQSLTPQTMPRGSLAFISVSSKTRRSNSLSPNFAKKHHSNCLVFSKDSKKEEELNEAKVQSSLRDFKRNHATWKQSKKLAIVMGIVVMLFYVSWLPIVVIITRSLFSKSTSQALHFAAARMSLISSMLNFLVYGGMLKQYRQAYRAILKKICCCGEQTLKKKETIEVEHPKPRRQKWFTSSSDKMDENVNARMKRVRFQKNINTVSPLMLRNSPKENVDKSTQN